MAQGLIPSLALSSRQMRDDGIMFTFTNVIGPFATLVAVVAALTFSLFNHSVTPALLLLLVPLFWLQNSWTFCYRGPTVKHQLSFLGITLWHRTWPLERTDNASADPVPDSMFYSARPQWYRLNLWSCALQRDREIMRSNEPDDLNRIVAMFNDAIREVCEKAAS